MRIIGCDLHARQQTLAMLDTTTGEMVNLTLMHEGNNVREFYSKLPRPVLVGIEATGSMHWFLNLMDELGIECRVGHPATIRAAEPRKQKHDRRDADLILRLLVEKRFPAIWLPTKEQLDLRALLLHRHQWVRMRTRIQNALQAIALANGLRRGPGLWSYDGQAKIAFLPLLPHASYRRSALQAMYKKMEEEIENLSEQVAEQAGHRSGARLLMTHPGVGPVTALATDDKCSLPLTSRPVTAAHRGQDRNLSIFAQRRSKIPGITRVFIANKNVDMLPELPLLIHQPVSHARTLLPQLIHSLLQRYR
jgi:transposase